MPLPIGLNIGVDDRCMLASYSREVMLLAVNSILDILLATAKYITKGEKLGDSGSKIAGQPSYTGENYARRRHRRGWSVANW